MPERSFRILFVFYDALRPGLAVHEGTYYSGIASVSAYLKQAGFHTSLLHLIQPIRCQEFQDQILQQQPDVVAFSATTNVFDRVLELSRWCKDVSKAPTVCGGVHATLCSDEIVRNASFDLVCKGEGEEAMLELCTKLRDGSDIPCHIPGLWSRLDGKVISNPPRRPLNLNELPFPDKLIFDYEHLENGRRKMGVLGASRGCPFGCTYCCNQSLAKALKLEGKSYVRFKDVEYIIAELKHELETFSFVKRIRFDDDILPLYRDWFEGFATRYKEEIGLPYECNLHPSLASSEVVSLMKYSGCDRVHMGLESGNDEVRSEILGRRISREQLVKAFKLCKQVGIYTYSFNIVGIPHESKQAMLDTVKLNAEVDTDQSQVSFYYPYVKTPLYHICEENGLITGRSLPSAGEDTVLGFRGDHLHFVRFVRHYFRVLVAIYGIVRRLPRFVGRGLEGILDGLLCFRPVGVLLLPPVNWLMRVSYRNRFLFKVGRRAKRTLLEKGWEKIS